MRTARPVDDRSAAGERSIQELWSDMAGDIGNLVRGEVALAKAEVKEQVATATKAGVMFGVGGVVALLALHILSVAAALGLAEVLPDAVAFAVVGVVYLVVAAVAVLLGRRRLSRFQPVPEQAMQTIKDDIKVAKSSLARGASAPAGRPALDRSTP